MLRRSLLPLVPLLPLVACAPLIIAPTASAALPTLELRAGPIADGPKTHARMVLRGARGGYRGRVGIELRGTSSAKFAKKSYALETRGPNGDEGRAVGLLGMPRESDWILSSAHADQTLMRNAVGYETARGLGRWAPRTRFVELRLNRRYQGVYVLTERPKVDRARVALRTQGVGGGYLLELSNTPAGSAFPARERGFHYSHHHPKADKLSGTERTWVAGHVGAAERALYGAGGDWRASFDEPAAIDYLLLQELFKNQDAFRRSTFVSKGAGALLQLGPVWDLDRAMGDSHAGADAGPTGWVTADQRPLVSPLLADPAFRERLVARWQAIRTTILPRMLAAVGRSARALRGAHVRNARRWPSRRVPGHIAEVRRLRAWLVARAGWIDANIRSLATTGPASGRAQAQSPAAAPAAGTARASAGPRAAGPPRTAGTQWAAGPPAAERAQAPAGALPRVTLRTTRRIRDEPRIRAHLQVPGSYDGFAGIELRGQSSQTFAKKPYALELRDRSGEERDAGLLGMKPDDDWILYAAHNDKSLMRNVVAYETARRLGRWAASTRFVELELNGRYQGVYVLMERIELNSRRVDVPGNGLTGSYLLEFTFPFQARSKGAHFTTPVKRRPIVYEEPERDDLSGREARYIRGVVRRTERALYSARPTAWRRHLDARVTVDYVLLQELFRNVDAFHGSTYLVKAAGRKLAPGPIWDLDLAMGNSTFENSRFVRGWWTRDRDWAERLWRDATFRRALSRRYRELRAGGLRAAVLASVDRSAAQLRPAAGRNFRRWPVLNRRIYQNPKARGSFGAEVGFLRSWLARRMAWMDRATRP